MPVTGVGLPQQINTNSRGGFNAAQGTPDAVNKLSYRIKTFDLTLARVNEIEPIAGNVIWCPTGSVNTAQLDIRLDDFTNDPIPFLPGAFIRGITFNKLILSNDAQAATTITVFIAKDTPENPIDVQ